MGWMVKTRVYKTKKFIYFWILVLVQSQTRMIGNSREAFLSLSLTLLTNGTRLKKKTKKLAQPVFLLI